MRPPDEARRDLVRRWLDKAEKDFNLARHLVAEGCSYREAIAFHSQQAAEKLLKAYLVLHQIDFPKTHNLGELLDLLASRDAPLADLLRDITALNPYGVEYRYPGDFPELTREDAEQAFRLAKRVRDAIVPSLSSGPELT
jgi:HEPN domain-containing protein